MKYNVYASAVNDFNGAVLQNVAANYLRLPPFCRLYVVED
jgi:hypothetical protein